MGPEVATFRTKNLNFYRVQHLKWLEKKLFEEAWLPIVVKISIKLLYSNILLNAKMLQETETKETLSFVVMIFVFGGFSIGEGREPIANPLGYANDKEGS